MAETGTAIVFTTPSADGVMHAVVVHNGEVFDPDPTDQDGGPLQVQSVVMIGASDEPKSR